MDERRCLMASSARRPMVGEQQQPPELSLNCPRCDSSNTKFCYYNNYSLSQPRHFCKACKRYWTRGGTIRNVPVGGGSRKNKRVKRSHTAAVTTTVTATDHLPSTHHSSHIVKPIFTEMNTVPTYYPRLSSNTLQDQLGLGYSSGQLLSGHGGHSLHDMASSGDVLPSDYSSNWIPCITSTEMITGSSTTTATCTTIPSINSLLASTIQHKTFSNSGDLQLKDHSSKAMEDCGGGWNFGYQNHHYPSEQVGLSSSDPSTNYYCNMSNVTGNNLYDPANTESSVPSLVKLSSIFANQSQDHLR